MANPSPSWQYLEREVERFKQELRKIQGEEDLPDLTKTSEHPLLNAYHTLRRSLQQLPGALLLTATGEIAWRRLLAYSKNESLTTAHLAKQLAGMLSRPHRFVNPIIFIDDALLVRLYDSTEFSLTKNPLGYAAFRIIYDKQPNPVLWNEILEEITSCGDRLCPRLTDDVLEHFEKKKSRRSLQRAVAKLPNGLRKHLHSSKMGRSFAWVD